MTDIFSQRKKDILSKQDKSSIGEWDEKILSLCDKINKSDNYYTTSSCSGRIMIIKDEDKKAPGLFEFVSHDKVRFDELKKAIDSIKQDSKFKQEPPILHIACIDLESAEELLKKAQLAGFKRSGIISLGKNIVVEIISTEKIEFPLIENGKIFVDDNFLKIVLEKANENMEKSWAKIGKLQKII